MSDLRSRTIRSVEALSFNPHTGQCAIKTNDGKVDEGPCRLVNVRGQYDTFWFGEDRVLITFRNKDWGQLFKCRILDDKNYFSNMGKEGFQVECETQ